MNFCGGGVEQQVCQDEYSSRLPDPPGCGCVQVESSGEDQLEIRDEYEGVEIPVGEISVPAARVAERPTRTPSRLERVSFTNSLACIDETLQDIGVLPKPCGQEDDGGEILFDAPSEILIKEVNASPQLKDDLTHTPISSFRECPLSPSPIYLNPLTTQDWSGVTPLFCPTLNNSQSNMENSRTVDSPVEECLRRIEEGFNVRLASGPPPLYCAGMNEVHLFLRQDRTKICLQSTQEVNRRKNEALKCGIEIAIHHIARLEVGRGSSPRQSFSLVVKKDAHDVSFFDLVAKSSLEKEVILSTLIVLLDQVNNKKHHAPKGSGAEWAAEGTIDQPILCSPSLEQEQEANPYGWEEGSSYHLPELAGDSFREPPPRELPRMRGLGSSGNISDTPNQIREKQMKLAVTERKLPVDSSYTIAEENEFDSKDDFSQLVAHGRGSQYKGIHPENNEDRDIKDSRIEESQRDHLIKGGFQDNEPRDEAAKADQDDLVLEGATSMQNPKLMNTPWCSDDVCSLALQNIADSCTGIFAMKQEDGFCRTPSIVAEQQELLEEYIATALGAPNAVYSYIMEGDVWNSEHTSPPKSDERLIPDSRKISNRAEILHAQAARLRTLRNEMTFTAALKQSRDRMESVPTTKSFDDANLKAASQAANHFHSSNLLQHVLNTMMLNDDTKSKKEETAFYDSDPEEIKPRAIHRLRPRRVEANRLYSESSGLFEAHKVRSVSRALDVIPTTKRVKKLDEDTIIDIVQVMNNERFTLMWHPTQNKKHPNRKPLCVRMWIESGVYLIDGNFLLPKLTWTKASEESQSEGKGNRKGTELQKVDLLDVCRICETTKIDRSRHPFALVYRSFFVETASNVFLFEAQNKNDRNRIVYGLKLVVARLASLLMLRDPRAADEFFCMAPLVPGEAPSWAQGKGSEESGHNKDKSLGCGATSE